MGILDIYEQQELKQKVMEIPDFKLPNTECHKKVFYDLPSIQTKLGITKFDLESAWTKRLPEQPVFLCTARVGDEDRNFWISNYTV